MSQCPEVPPQKGMVRGELVYRCVLMGPCKCHVDWLANISGFHVVPDGDACIVTYVMAIDLKGWIPPAVIVRLLPPLHFFSSRALIHPKNRANIDQPVCLADLSESLASYLAANPTFGL